MNNIIRQLSKIEADTVRILDSGTQRKKELSETYEQITKQFDLALDQETAGKIAGMKESLERSMEEQLERQKEEADSAVRKLEEHYNAQHTRYVDMLFRKMTEV